MAEFKRMNLIDGIPSSYDVTYVLKNNKSCCLCGKKITKNNIKENAILYTDEFDYTHKECFKLKTIEYRHLRPDDASSPVIIIIEKNKHKKTVEQEVVKV